MTEALLRELATKLGTPSYVFNKDEFLQRVLLVKEKFGSNVAICFSIKANPFLLGDLPECFDKIEVCSPGELTICEKTNTDMNKIIFSGVNKTMPDVERAMTDGVGTFTAESMMHVNLINESAIKHRKKVPVLLRLTGGSQFGMDESEVLKVISNRDNFKGIEITGVHYFTGTQKRKPAAIIKELDRIEQFTDKVKEEYNFELKNIEYGTGLAVDYFKEDADALEEERLEGISQRISQLGQKIKLTIEMGRFFAAPCGYYFTKVIDAKTCCEINYAICDGGLNQLKYDGQIQGMQIPKITHIKSADNDSQDESLWTLCGSLCTTADVLARNVAFKSLKADDILVFHRTGAYSAMEGMAVFLSREMPKIALYSKKDGLQVIRNMILSDQFNTPVIR